MFPGQGSQQAGMGKELLDRYSNFLIDDFEETLGWSLQEVILNSTQEEVRKTNIAQPYICLLYTSPSPRDLSTSRMPSSA